MLMLFFSRATFRLAFSDSRSNRFSKNPIASLTDSRNPSSFSWKSINFWVVPRLPSSSMAWILILSRS